MSVTGRSVKEAAAEVRSDMLLSCALLQTYKVREQSLGKQVEVLHSADCDGEQTLALCEGLSRGAQTQDRQQ